MSRSLTALWIILRHPASTGQRRLRLMLLMITVPMVGLVGLFAYAESRSIDTICSERILRAAAHTESEIRHFFGPLPMALDALVSIETRYAIDKDSGDLQTLQSAFICSLEGVDGAWFAYSDGRIRFWNAGKQDWIAPAELEDSEKKEILALCDRDGVDSERVEWHELSRGDLLAYRTYHVSGSQTRGLIALRMSQHELTKFIEHLSLEEIPESDVRVVVFGEDQVIEIAAGLDDKVQIVSRAEFLRDLNPNLAQRLEGPVSKTLAFPLVLDKTPMWCALRPIGRGEPTTVLGLAATSKALLAEARQVNLAIAIVLLAIILIGSTGAVLLAWRYREQLREAAARPQHTQSDENELMALIAGGENERLEFKSTMRWNLKADKPGKEISHAWLKTVAAYLNTEGGTLLIGVEDNGHILGIDADKFPNEDKYLLHFNNLLKEHIGLEVANLIQFALRPVGEKKILVVDCLRSENPVFVRSGEDEEFFIRVGPGSRKLPTSKVIEYLRTRRVSGKVE